MPYLQTIYPQSCRKLKLSTAENLLLMTVRLWVCNRHKKHKGINHWHEGLLLAGLDDGSVNAFNQLLSILNGISIRSLQFHYPTCACIGNDEGLFLEMFALLQLKQFESTKEILGYWLPPQIVALAIPPARNLASALVAGGLFIPPRDRERGTDLSQQCVTNFTTRNPTIN